MTRQIIGSGTKSSICSSCGKRYSTKQCSCKKTENRNEYQKKYYEENSEHLKLLRTARWSRLRRVIIHRDNGICQRCYSKYGIITSDELQVHHILPRIKYPELIYDETNLITLCKTCNLQLGIQEELDFEPQIDLKNLDFDFKL